MDGKRASISLTPGFFIAFTRWNVTRVPIRFILAEIRCITLDE